MNLKDFELGTLAYAENNVLPNLNSTLDRWVMYAGLAAGGANAEKMIGEIVPTMQMLGFIDNNGEINLDALEDFGMVAFKKQPKVKIWKLTFTENDFKDYIQTLRNGVCVPDETKEK